MCVVGVMLVIRYDKIPTEVSGKGAAGIGHIDSFGEAKLDAGILRNIEK